MRKEESWGLGLAVAVLAGAVYLALRPPLFNYDGYVYRLQAFSPFQDDNLNPHHLLWHPLQAGLLKISESIGHPTTAPFQIFGLAINCLTLALFCRLLLKLGAGRIFSASATLFVAFSPKFWLLGMQNQPYPLVFLSLVLYLDAWFPENGSVPEGLRLAQAGLSLAVATFFQQAAALLVPAGALALLICSHDSWRWRFRRAVFWSGSVAGLVLAVYLGMSRFAGTTGIRDFASWTTRYLETQHSLQVQFPEFLSKSVIGILRSVVQTYRMENYLREHLSNRAILQLYGALGLLAGAGIAWALRKSPRFRQLVRHSPLFTVCLLSLAAWSAFVFAWEPTGYYWGLNLFPSLVCVGMLVRGRPARIFSSVFIVLGAWNLYANHARDKVDSINFPEPLVEAIQHHLGSEDIFIVLGRDWFGEMDYDLLLTCLDRYPRNPGRAILHDWVMPQGESGNWREKMRSEIESALDSEGMVFVAEHVFWTDSYADLQQAQDPFAEFIHEEYRHINGPALYREVEQVFDEYELEESSFKLGPENFLELRRPR